MAFLLSSKNIFTYLEQINLARQVDAEQSQLELKSAKNFNLLITLPDHNQILVKQERFDREGKTAGEFSREWRIQKFIRQFSELDNLQFWLPEIIHFDRDNSILIVKYLSDYSNLAEFYGKDNIFPAEIASSIGKMIATIHRQTINNSDYQEFFSSKTQTASTKLTQKLVQGLTRITPEIFGQVPADGLKFFTLYQRYDSLGKAIAELNQAFQPGCVTHNDLKLNNLLLSNNWQKTINQKIELKLIDWERSGWGDPAFDLGTLIGSYLVIWLQSLVVSKSIEINESLRLAMTPLETLQPSLAALATTYASNFPEILEYRPDFWQRVMQFSGLALIQSIQSTLQYQKSFNNTGICMLQVAKTLLCRPTESISTVLGIDIQSLNQSKLFSV
jgi:5-methylthioribose kinase